MSLPADLSPETATWLRMQMTLAASRAVQPLLSDLRDLEGFVDSMLVAVSQLVPAIIEADPKLAAQIAPQWRQAAERFEALQAGELPRRDDEPAHLLEARQLLYRACEQRRLWPAADREPRRMRLVSRAPH